MHSCIAAISQAIPTIAIAYSDKAYRVFETVGASKYVMDGRKHDTQEVVSAYEKNISHKEDARKHLKSAKPHFDRALSEQFAKLSAQIEGV